MTVPILSESKVPRTERLPGPPGPCELIDADEVAPPLESADPAQDRLAVDVIRTVRGDPEHTALFRLLHREIPEAAHKLARATARLPAAGDTFCGFHLVAELGRGAFGRVFLAEQPELGDRAVVLKVSLDVQTEVQALARLLHTNIAPVYSVHRAEPLQAVCMPYCGGTTLAHAVRRFRGETIPESGRGLITLLNSSATSIASPVAGNAPPPVVHQPGSNSVLDLLGGLSYVDAILWIGARLADALAHAHDRGILHRDLKPANILLTDEGQPMLLDFNLATDTRLEGIAEVARLGGTLPYMPPEHIESFAGEKRVVDARGDLYALGVILFELLTGRPPFPEYRRLSIDVLRQMVLDRLHPPSLRDRNPAVSMAVEAIVRKCLDPLPTGRYASAHDLKDDLERQLRHRPLRHAPEPSWRERVRKWARRHPRLSSSACLAGLAAILLAFVAGVAGYEHQRRLGLEARETWNAFQDEGRRFQFSLTGLPEDDRRPLLEALELGRQTIDRYPAPNEPEWKSAWSVRHLPDGDRQALREETGVLLVLLAHATARTSDSAASALYLNEQAAACFPADAAPPALWAQRVELLDRLGRREEAEAFRQQAAARPVAARDLCLSGWERARHGRYAEAIPLLQEATRLDPATPWAWFLMGRCHDGVGRDADAVSCYSACLAIRPDLHVVWYNRGMASYRRGDFQSARADLDRALDLKPGVADAYYNRGLAKKALRDYRGAELDFTRALEHGAGYTRVYFVRADVRDRLGNRDGAASDRQKGLATEPVEESCWTARGFARMTTDPKGALQDFDRALLRNPRYRPALINKAHVLADLLRRPAEAVRVLDEAIRFHPEQANLQAARAVYQARLGRRAEAHRDAEDALKRSGDPAIRYQVAGVYALTSRTYPEDRQEAFRLLAMALQRNVGFEHLDTDPELDPVRHLLEFKQLVTAARALRPVGR